MVWKEALEEVEWGGASGGLSRLGFFATGTKGLKYRGIPPERDINMHYLFFVVKHQFTDRQLSRMVFEVFYSVASSL